MEFGKKVRTETRKLCPSLTIRPSGEEENQPKSLADHNAANISSLLLIMWSHGTGSEIMRRIAAAMIGGMISATVLSLLVIPVLYMMVKQGKDIAK